jgi:protein MpaA
VRVRYATSGAGLCLIALLGTGCTGADRPAGPSPFTGHRLGRAAQHRPLVTDPVVHQRVVLGRSVDGRPIVAEHLGDPDGTRRILVVGCIHGNERAGMAIADALTKRPTPAEVDLWVIRDLNPDGAAARTRGNAHGVDLNRNFPFRWRPLGRAGSASYAGPHALSEPESRIAARLMLRLRPTLGIWYHQALAVVDDSQGPLRLERSYSSAAGLPLRALKDYPGSAVGFEDHRFHATAFVVELPAGRLDRGQVSRHRRGVLAVPRPR